MNVVFADLPDDVREMELLLSIDGGRSWPLRLTSRLEPRPSSFRWTIPRIPTSAARLRLRVGQNGEEVEAEPGGTFAITLPPVAEPAPFVFREGEWWIGPGRASRLAQRFLSEAPAASPWGFSDEFDGLLPDDEDHALACLPQVATLEPESRRGAARADRAAPVRIVTLLSIPKRE